MTGGSPAPARAQPAAAAAAAAERAAAAARSTAFSSAFSSADLRDLFSLQDDCKSDTYEKVMRAKRDEAEKAAAALNAEQDSPENPFGLDEDEGEGEAAAATCEHQLQNGNPSEIDLPDWAHHPDLHLKKHEGSEESSLEDAALRASRAEDISFVFTNVTAGVEFEEPSAADAALEAEVLADATNRSSSSLTQTRESSEGGSASGSKRPAPDPFPLAGFSVVLLGRGLRGPEADAPADVPGAFTTSLTASAATSCESCSGRTAREWRATSTWIRRASTARHTC